MTSPLSSSEDRAAALAVVNYWREIHAEVLQRALEDIEGLIAVDSEVLVAGRIKKLSTIVDKLGRADAPFDLQTMYDIAGCRLVVPDLEALERVYSEIADLPALMLRRQGATTILRILARAATAEGMPSCIIAIWYAITSCSSRFSCARCFSMPGQRQWRCTMWL